MSSERATPDPANPAPAAEPEPRPSPLKDLDINPEDADKVKGGLRRTGDPCDGGE